MLANCTTFADCPGDSADDRCHTQLFIGRLSFLSEGGEDSGIVDDAMRGSEGREFASSRCRTRPRDLNEKHPIQEERVGLLDGDDDEEDDACCTTSAWRGCSSCFKLEFNDGVASSPIQGSGAAALEMEAAVSSTVVLFAYNASWKRRRSSS